MSRTLAQMIAVTLLGLLINSVMAAAIQCPPMPTVMTGVTNDVKSDISATVGRLGKLKAGELAVKTEIVSKNLFDKYPNIDKLVALQTMAATYCGMLNQSSISDPEKLDRWERFQDKVLDLQTRTKPFSEKNDGPIRQKQISSSLSKHLASNSELSSNHSPTAKKSRTSIPSGTVIKDCTTCPEMVVIPSGKFEMGTRDGDSNEAPLHSVSVKAFALGKIEVTQGQWRKVMGSNPSHFSSCGDDCPVEMVSWNDAQAFIEKLSDKTGKQYRLPSEAEWEYACRAGGRHTYCGSDSFDKVAWYAGNSSDTTHPVSRQKPPNAFGLYDMSGNVLEWVEDCYHSGYDDAPEDGSAWLSENNGICEKRMLRGGSMESHYVRDLRSAYRFWWDKSEQPHWIFGFRLARTLP